MPETHTFMLKDDSIVVVTNDEGSPISVEGHCEELDEWLPCDVSIFMEKMALVAELEKKFAEKMEELKNEKWESA